MSSISRHGEIGERVDFPSQAGTFAKAVRRGEHAADRALWNGSTESREQFEGRVRTSFRDPDIRTSKARAPRRLQLLEWCAEVSTDSEERLRRQRSRRNCSEAEPGAPRGAFVRALLERDWDPGKHPRGGYPDNRGWFSPSEGAAGVDSQAAGFEPTATDLRSPSGIGNNAFAYFKPPRPSVPLEQLTDDPSLYLPSLDKGGWPKGAVKGEGPFNIKKPFNFKGQLVKTIPFTGGVPILDKFAIGNSPTIIITGDSKVDFANARELWIKNNPKIKLPKNARFHHNLLQVTEETVTIDGKKVRVLVGKMQLIPQKIHRLLSHQGSASIGRRFYRQLGTDLAVIKKLARGEVLEGGGKIIARALKKLTGNRVPEWAKKLMGRKVLRKLPIVGAPFTLIQFSKDAEAHGVGGAAVRATPVLGDVISLIDTAEEIRQQIDADTKKMLKASDEATNASVAGSHQLALETTLIAFQELADEIEVTNDYLNADVISQAVKQHYNAMQRAYRLKFESKGFDFTRAAAEARQALKNALIKEAQRNSQPTGKERVI